MRRWLGPETEVGGPSTDCPRAAAARQEASFRLIVTGKIGVKEIERLIQKLQIDKEILADQDDGPDDDDIADANQTDRKCYLK